MRRILFAAFLFCFVQAYAKDNPIPEVILTAKTACVGNRGALPKDIERLKKSLKEWGRFEIIEDVAKADIMITLSAQTQSVTMRLPNTGSGMGGVQNQMVLINYIHIADARNGAEVYTDETPTESSDPRQLINKLKNRIKKQEK